MEKMLRLYSFQAKGRSYSCSVQQKRLFNFTRFRKRCLTEWHTFELEGELCKNAFETIYSVSLWESTKNKDVWLAIGGAGKRKMEEQNDNRSEGQKAKPLEEKTNKTLEQQTKNSNYLKLDGHAKLQGLAIVGNIGNISFEHGEDSKKPSVGFKENSKKEFTFSASVNFVKLFGSKGKPIAGSRGDSNDSE